MNSQRLLICHTTFSAPVYLWWIDLYGGQQWRVFISHDRPYRFDRYINYRYAGGDWLDYICLYSSDDRWKFAKSLMFNDSTAIKAHSTGAAQRLELWIESFKMMISHKNRINIAFWNEANVLWLVKILKVSKWTNILKYISNF